MHTRAARLYFFSRFDAATPALIFSLRLFSKSLITFAFFRSSSPCHYASTHAYDLLPPAGVRAARVAY